jgi:hypothetical protein
MRSIINTTVSGNSIIVFSLIMVYKVHGFTANSS